MIWLDLVLGLTLAFVVSGLAILLLAGWTRTTRRHVRSLEERERENERRAEELRKRQPGDRINGKYVLDPADGEGSEK